MLYWQLLFTRIIFPARSKQQELFPSISVVIVFKNELKNLKNLIPKLLKQDYLNFDLILCDDYSSDGSYEYVSALVDPKITVHKASQDLPGKKFALREAIRQSTSQKILVTDADCLPLDDAWIRSMALHSSNKSILLGYSPHEKASGFLNKFIRFETYMTALQYFSYALAKIPYMGVGRNLMYDKVLFENNTPSDKANKLISGDDDLFVNAAASASNTAINLDPKSFMATASSTSWGAFFRQKRRHLSASIAYRFHHQVLLSLFAVSHVLLYVLFFIGVVTLNSPTLVLAFGLILILKWIISAYTMKRLACKDLVLYFPLLDFGLACYYIIMAPFSFFKPKNW